MVTADAARARAELDAYGSEDREWSELVAPLPHQRGSWGGVLGFAGVLVLAAILEYQNAFGADWAAAGREEAAAIRHGGW